MGRRSPTILDTVVPPPSKTRGEHARTVARVVARSPIPDPRRPALLPACMHRMHSWASCGQPREGVRGDGTRSRASAGGEKARAGTPCMDGSMMESSLFHSAVGAEEGGGLSRSATLFQSVVHDETPEETVRRIREERVELKQQLVVLQQDLQTVEQIGVEQMGDKEQALEEVEQLSRQLSDMGRAIAEKDYRILEVERAMEALDDYVRQLEEEHNEMAEAADAPEPEREGELTASGSFLTKSDLLRRELGEKEQWAVTAEATVREKEKLVIKLARENDEIKQEVAELYEKNQQDDAYRLKQNVSPP